MRIQLLLVVYALATFIGAEAQKPDTAGLMVHYKYVWVRDTTDRTHPYTENMVLFVGTSASAYRSYDGLAADLQFKKAWAEAAASSPDGQPRINRRGVGSRTQYYQYPAQQKLFTKDMLMVNAYLIEGPIPAIDWKISSDTATFGGLHCQKATCHFKGRDYIAWFCPDLPVHSGPWKLNGLPGVIVDAHDSKNEVVFQFDGVEKTAASLPKLKSETGSTDDNDLPPVLRGLNDDPNVIVPPARTTKTTQKEFDKLRETMEKDPAAFAQALNAANNQSNGPRQDHIMVAPKGSQPPGPVINNPVELSEK
ncbi:MAG: GLPGLI family protein [Bacteroidetes bacterium]|nr:GLPGLI family protein [Bacteroidota bacterium]